MKPERLPLGVTVTHAGRDEFVYLNRDYGPEHIVITMTVNETLELARQLVEHAGYAADA